MELDFLRALDDARIGGAAGIVRLANEQKPPASYLLTTILPERVLPGYDVDAATMTVRAIMAHAVGMDSKYPEGGAVEMATFREQIAKYAIQQNLSEKAIRGVQELARDLLARGQGTTDLAVNTVLNFVNKLLLQPHFDRAEFLRGEALFTGMISDRTNGSNVVVDYGVPAANKFATRTGTDAYNSTASKFWTDTVAARRILGNAYRVSMASRATIEGIIYNDANKINVLDIEGGRYTIQRYVGEPGGLRTATQDARERMTLVEYQAEGEILDLTSANRGKTIKVPFVPDGVVGHFGAADRSREFIPGEGATEDPRNELELGYTHIGPTVEGGGAAGRWARVYTPEGMPMQIRGQSVSNMLPVILSPEKIVLASTTLV